MTGSQRANLDPPVNAKRKRRQSPLEVAVEKGFYSLTELLLDGGCDPLANGNPLYDAVNRNEADIAKLLRERGVPIDSVDISTVFQADRSMIKLFISVGRIRRPIWRIMKRSEGGRFLFCMDA